jgi:hypothetical protein
LLDKYLVYDEPLNDSIPGSWSKRYMFPNGFGASVITNFTSIPLYPKDTWELAVMYGDEITYDTPITDGVIMGLSWNEAEDLIEQVYNLPKL